MTDYQKLTGYKNDSELKRWVDTPDARTCIADNWEILALIQHQECPRLANSFSKWEQRLGDLLAECQNMSDLRELLTTAKEFAEDAELVWLTIVGE